MVEGQNPGAGIRVHLPKYSAIRGKDEKCSADPATGAGSPAAPLAFTRVCVKLAWRR
jgi:hypothetical protein